VLRASTSFFFYDKKDVDGRDKPGHDVEGTVTVLDIIKNIILVSQRPLHEGRLPEAS
jgi:hypothetical protein